MSKGFAAIFITVGVLLLLLGGMGGGAAWVLIMAAVLLIAVGTLGSRKPRTANKDSAVIEQNGVTWTRDAAGGWLRWNPDQQAWEESQPPPPDALRDRSSDPEKVSTSAGVAVGVTIFVVALVGLGLWAAVDPYANIPGVSKMVCSLKGQSWQEGSALLNIPPGCYVRSTESSDSSGAENQTSTGEDYVAAMEDALKNAATAEESYAVGNNGEYTPFADDLWAEGLTVPTFVTLSIITVGPGYYCIEATHTDTTDTYFYDSNNGIPLEGSCPAVD